jgi:hypothetical protein
MPVQVDSNERDRSGSAVKPLEKVQREVMAFLTHEAGFAQVCTVNRHGFPVARTMGAPVNDDWSVDLVQRGTHRRLGQLRRNARLEVIWVGAPALDSVNDRPHVYDFGLAVPRVVFLRGVAEFMDADWTVARFQRLTEVHRRKQQTRAPDRTPDNVRAELVGIRVWPLQVRAEGFGTGAKSFTWPIEEGM